MIDLAIVGAGAAGLTAAVYAARAGLDFVVLEQDGYGGGQIASAHLVENYPGVGRLSGEALSEAFRQQALELGADIRLGTVERAADQGTHKTLYLDDGEVIEARAVLAATGSVPKALGVPGEAALVGAGVSYCALCDGAFFQGRSVLVVGGGDTAVEDGLYLSGICARVTVALRSDTFRAAKRRVELLSQQDNVTILKNTTVSAIQGTEGVTAVSLMHQGQERSYPVEGVFVAVGTEPMSHWLTDLHPAMENGFVKADESGVTDVPGLFVAGDLRQKPLRQVITAAADGANAVTSAVHWLQTI